MKAKLSILSVLAIACLVIVACSNDDHGPMEEYNYEPMQSAATIKTLSDGSRILQLDQDNVLQASNIKEFAESPDGRVIVSYEDHGQITAPAGNNCKWHLGKILKVDPITTNKPIEYGDSFTTNDRIEILLDNPMTCVQDGYLTIAYQIGSGGKNVPHRFTLRKRDTPLEFELHHDNNGDIIATEVKEGVVAFDLRDLLPTNGEAHKILIKYMGFSTGKTMGIIFKDGRYNAPTKLLTCGGPGDPESCIVC